MKILDLTFDTPQENLACDEALLDRCEKENSGEILRFWEAPIFFVVLGFSNAWKEELRAGSLKEALFPVLRRVSGGGTVLQGPGCLSYSLILRIRPEGPLAGGILSSNRHIMEVQRGALEKLLQKPVQVKGSTDLTLENLKFSGNSQRRGRRALLFHGTFLLDFDLKKVEACLRMPPKQPAYRQNRPHQSFLTNLSISKDKVKEALAAAWNAKKNLTDVPTNEILKLAKEKYSNPGWNFRR
jgi:lipoate-protein ligase A